MISRTGGALAALAAAALLAGTAARVQAAELGFLEMLFGARPAPQQAQPAPDAYARSYGPRPSARVGAARNRLRTRYAALPVRIRVKERDVKERDTSGRQTPIDMKAGAAAAFLRDETLRPGDIVVLNTGARVFTGDPDKRHAMRDFEPVDDSDYVSRGTRRQLAGMLAPAGALPADEARRVVARMRRAALKGTPAAEPETAPVQATAQSTAMRVINPWQSGQ